MSTFLRNNLTVCWPLIGLQVAALLCIRRRRWPPVIAGMVISQLVFERLEPLDEIVSDTACDVAELLIAALSLPPLDGLSKWMKEPHLFRRFVIWPMLLGPGLTAFPVAAAFARELHVTYWSYYARWFAGDMLGIVLWLPLGLVLMSRETYALFTWRALPRTFGLLALLYLSALAIFHIKLASVAFAIMPVLLLIALKIGFSGSVIAVNLLCVVSAEGTLHHLGPFGALPDLYSVTLLQVFLTFSMLMCFPVSILLLERDDFERETKNAYQRMQQLATIDSLTGLANRRHFDAVFDEEWRRAMREGHPIAVMMIDVDCFKLFNDHYGHLAGDDCLRRIAHSIKTTIKRAGDVAARFGGEEFIVLMPSTDVCGVSEVAESVRSQVECMRLEHLRNPHQIVTISVGYWSMVPKAEIQSHSLILAADQGLYAAKERGRNSISGMVAESLKSVSDAS